MFIPFLYELRARERSSRHTGVARAGARARRGPARQLARRLLPRGARAPAFTTRRKLDAFDEAFLAHFEDVESKGVELDGGAARVAAGRAHADGRAHAEKSARSSKQLDLEELRRLFEERLARAERAPRRRQPLDRHGRHLAVRHSGRAARGGDPRRRARRRAERGEGRRRPAVPPVPQRPHARRPADVRSRCASFAASRARAPTTSSTSTRPSTRPRKNAGELEVVTRPPRRPSTRVVLLMDVGRLDGSLRASRRAPLHRGEQVDALQGAPHLLLPQLRLRHASTGPSGSTTPYGSATCFTSAGGTTSSSSSATRSWRRTSSFTPGDRSTSATTPAWKASRGSMRLASHFDRAAWLNPEPVQYWQGNTIDYVRQVFPMFELTLDGLGEAVGHLVKGPARRVR